MALPNSINPDTPLGTDAKKFGDDQIRAFKQFVVDILGLPENTPITAAPFNISAAGIITSLGNITAPVRINASSDAFVTFGLVVDQAQNDDLVGVFKSSGDVSTPFTSLFSSSTFGALGKASALTGGLALYGVTGGGGLAPGVLLQGLLSTPNSAKSSSAIPAILEVGNKTDGITGATVLSATDNLWGVANGTSNVVLLADADGALRIRPGVTGVTPGAAYDDLVVEGKAGAPVGLSLITPDNTDQSGIAFGDPQNASVGQINYDHNSGIMGVIAENELTTTLAGERTLRLEPGRVSMGERNNTKISRGLNVDVGLVGGGGTGSKELFAIQRDFSAHGVTNLSDTNTVFSVFNDLGVGHTVVHSIGSSGVRALALQGIAQVNSVEKSVAAAAPVITNSARRSGTGTQGMVGSGNLFIVQHSGQSVFIVDAEGDLHVLGSTTLTPFDKYDDVKLLTAARASLMPEGNFKARYADYIREYAPVLARHGIITYNSDGCHFVSQKGMQGLLIDTIRQLADRITQLEAHVHEL